MKLSEMRDILDSGQIQLTKSLGQNFLHDGNQLQRIIAAGEVSAHDQVLEIGPGLGPLTELLVQRGQHVLAIEKDRRLVAFLQEKFGAEKKLEILHADALDFLKKESRDWRGWKLVANLPYSVASPILVELALSEHPPERMTATLQIEVADRTKAVAGDDDYGVLSLLLQVRYSPENFFKIPRGCFFPQPDVDSACITLVRRQQELLPFDLLKPFVQIVKQSLSQRRKMMHKLLKQIGGPDWDKLMSEAGIPLDVRGEKVSLEAFVKLTRLYAESR